MFGLILIFVLVWLALMAVLYIGALFFQGYIYTEPMEGLYWRAPAAGSALAVFVICWCFLCYRNPDGHAAVYDFNARETKEFEELECWKGRVLPLTGEPGKEDEKLSDSLVLKNVKKTKYRKTASQGVPTYVAVEGGKPWSRGDAEGMCALILVKEEGKDKPTRFLAEFDVKKGSSEATFKLDRNQFVRYVEVGGSQRVMTDDQIGRLAIFLWGRFLLYFFLNIFHLALWFACLWLLLRFQWSHALGLAVVLWGMMTLLILPMLFDKTKRVKDERARAMAPFQPDASHAGAVMGRG